MNEQQNNSDHFVDNVLFSYQTSRQGSTKFTPFYIMYNREARFPIDVCISGRSKVTDDTTVDDAYRHGEKNPLSSERKHTQGTREAKAAL